MIKFELFCHNMQFNFIPKSQIVSVTNREIVNEAPRGIASRNIRFLREIAIATLAQCGSISVH